MTDRTSNERVAKILKQLGEHTLHYSDQDEAYYVMKAALAAHETECDAAPVAVSDLLAECARRYAGDVALCRPHPLWGAIEAYEAARAGTQICVCGEPNTIGVQHRTDGPCFVIESAQKSSEPPAPATAPHTTNEPCAPLLDGSEVAGAGPIWRRP